MPVQNTRCPMCSRRSLEYVENGGVAFFFRVRFDEAGRAHAVEDMEGCMVAVLGVPVWACRTPGCMYGKPVEAASPMVDKLAEDQCEDAVRLFL